LTLYRYRRYDSQSKSRNFCTFNKGRKRHETREKSENSDPESAGFPGIQGSLAEEAAKTRRSVTNYVEVTLWDVWEAAGKANGGKKWN